MGIRTINSNLDERKNLFYKNKRTSNMNEQKILNEIRATNRDLEMRRDEIFTSVNDFLEKLQRQAFFGGVDDEISKLNSKYSYEDFEEEEEEDTCDQVPVNLRAMRMDSRYIFSQSPKQKKEKKEEAPPVPVQPIQPKIPLVDHETQSYRSQLSTVYNFPIQIFPAQAAPPTVTYSTQSTNTKTRRSNKVTNTEALLPQYEAKFMEFLQNVLNDAPILVNSQPSEEAVGDLLLQFLQQILRDAPDLSDDDYPYSDDEGAGSEKRPLGIGGISGSTVSRNGRGSSRSRRGRNSSIAKPRMAETTNAAVQLESPERADNGTQSPTTIIINEIEKHPAVSILPAPKPTKVDPNLAISPAQVNEHPEDSKLLQVGPTIQLHELNLPPPLRVEDIGTSPMVLLAEDRHVNLTRLYREIDIPPTSFPRPNQSVLPFDPIPPRPSDPRPTPVPDSRPTPTPAPAPKPNPIVSLTLPSVFDTSQAPSIESVSEYSLSFEDDNSSSLIGTYSVSTAGLGETSTCGTSSILDEPSSTYTDGTSNMDSQEETDEIIQGLDDYSSGQIISDSFALSDSDTDSDYSN